MKRLLFLFPSTIGLLLAACSSISPVTQTTIELEVVQPTRPSAGSTQALADQPAQPAGSETLQLSELTDSQGAVTVTVKPFDLNESQDRLSFEVSMNTHSVDLGMNLAALATLTTDNGHSVQAMVWDAKPGGHHVSGTLSFPASVDGKSILEGASKLTLEIKNVDAPERLFAWKLK